MDGDIGMGLVQRWLLKRVLGIVAHPRLTLGAAAVVVLACGLYASQKLTVSSDQNKLFSPKVRFFHDWLEFNRKFPENQGIYIVIEPRSLDAVPPIEQWVQINGSITARLKKMPQVQEVLSRVPLHNPLAPPILFSDPKSLPAEFNELKEFVPLAQFWGEEPSGLTGLLGRTPMARFLNGLLAQSPNPQTSGFVAALCQGWIDTARQPTHPPVVPDVMTIGAKSPSQLGYFYVPDASPSDPPHSLMLIQVREREDRTGLTTEAAIINAIRDAVNQQAQGFPQFAVGMTGRPVLDADQDVTTDRDGMRAEILALTVVFIGLVIFLRSAWLAVVAEVSLAAAIGWTYGWATLSVGQLNLLSTVFLIALIGIGMDYLIQILAAYRREARRYVRPSAVWARVFRHVGPPVNTACLGAAGAFLVSALTDFKGAAELGIIAGGGLLLCLLSAYTVLPALLVVWPAKLKPYPASARYGRAPARSRMRLLLPIVWIIALAAGIPFALKANFNPNLLDLQAPNLPSVQLVRKLQTWEAVVLTTDLNMLGKVRDAAQKAPTVAGTDSILRAIDNQAWLKKHASELPQIRWTEPRKIEPEDLPIITGRARALAAHLSSAGPALRADSTSQPTAQESTRNAGPTADPDAMRAAELLNAFADQITAPNGDANQIAAALSAWQVEFVDQLKRLMAMRNPPPLKLENISPALRQHLASTIDQPPGQPLYALHIEPKHDLWKKENLERFMQDVERQVATVPGAPDVTGIASDIYHSTEAIEQAFYQATAYALIVIFVLVYIDLRNWLRTVIAVSVLALGLPMLVAVMGMLDVSWNFANFFGLPILIGAGHEYGVFMMHRFKEAWDDPRRVWRRWDPADRALLLCAFVTCSSFGFFYLMSSHLGLKSLGAVMALGTFCIYLAAILVVRPLLTWRLEHRRMAQSQEQVSSSLPDDVR
jgi:hypothetical protein